MRSTYFQRKNRRFIKLILPSKQYKNSRFKQPNGLSTRNLQYREIKNRRFEIRSYLEKKIDDLRKVFACTVTYYITKTLCSEVTAHSSASSCAYPHINMHTYVGGCVRAGTSNLILNFASYYYAPWTWPRSCTVYR